MKINYLRNMGVRRKLLLLFIFSSFIPLVALAGLILNQFKNELIRSVNTELQSLSKVRAENVETFLATLRRDLRVLQKSELVLENYPIVDKYITVRSNQAYRKAVASLNKELGVMQRGRQFDDIFIFNEKGKIIYASDIANSNHYLGSDSPAPDFDYQKAKNGIYYSKVYKDPIKGGSIEMLAVAPLNNGKGVIAIQIDMRRVFEQFESDRKSDQAQTLVFKKEQGAYLALNALDQKPDAALNYSISNKQDGFQWLEEMNQGQSNAIYNDENNLRVLSSAEKIVKLNWLVVVKRNYDEVTKPINDLFVTVVLILIVIMALALTLALYISSSIVAPLTGLTEATKEMAMGNLDIQINQNLLEGKDETGSLAKSFSNMVGQLRIARDDLEKQISETKEALRVQETLAMKLEKSNEDLVKSNSELDAFAYIASHDLKEPLRGINNYSIFLKEDYSDKLDDEGKEKLDTLQRLCARLESFIDSLLKFSRVGRTELAIQAVDLNEIVDEIYDTLHVTLQAEEINFKFNKDLPTIECDKVRVGEVYRNLITNAMKYNNKDDKLIELGFYDAKNINDELGDKVKGYLNKNIIVFYVKDNGIGIREKYLDTVFKMFKRLHGREKFGGGTGAGLTIVKKIVEELHGGEIWVESEFKAGSTFYFTLQREAE